jgi:Zn-dependent alcohol dehydrogenase
MSASGPGHDGVSHTVRQIHDDIEQTLDASTARGEGCALRLERAFKSGGGAVWNTMKRHPFAAVLVLGAAAVAVASAVGAAELAFGTAIAIAAYRVLREGEPPLQAFEEVVREIPA